MLDENEALDRLRRGEFALTRHAIEQMEVRRIGAESIEACARNA